MSIINQKQEGIVQFLPLVLLGVFAITTIFIARQTQLPGSVSDIRSRAAYASCAGGTSHGSYAWNSCSTCVKCNNGLYEEPTSNVALCGAKPAGCGGNAVCPGTGYGCNAGICYHLGGEVCGSGCCNKPVDNSFCKDGPLPYCGRIPTAGSAATTAAGRCPGTGYGCNAGICYHLGGEVCGSGCCNKPVDSNLCKDGPNPYCGRFPTPNPTSGRSVACPGTHDFVCDGNTCYEEGAAVCTSGGGSNFCCRASVAYINCARSNPPYCGNAAPTATARPTATTRPTPRPTSVPLPTATPTSRPTATRTPSPTSVALDVCYNAGNCYSCPGNQNADYTSIEECQRLNGRPTSTPTRVLTPTATRTPSPTRPAEATAGEVGRECGSAWNWIWHGCGPNTSCGIDSNGYWTVNRVNCGDRGGSCENGGCVYPSPTPIPPSPTTIIVPTITPTSVPFPTIYTAPPPPTPYAGTPGASTPGAGTPGAGTPGITPYAAPPQGSLPFSVLGSSSLQSVLGVRCGSDGVSLFGVDLDTGKPVSTMSCRQFSPSAICKNGFCLVNGLPVPVSASMFQNTSH